MEKFWKLQPSSYLEIEWPMLLTTRIKRSFTIGALAARVHIGFDGRAGFTMSTVHRFCFFECYSWPRFGRMIGKCFVALVASVKFPTTSKLDGNNIFFRMPM